MVLDGTDNFSTRYLLNDACVKLGKPWVYCGVLASYGMTHTVQPGVTPCLRCIMGELPAPGTVATCDTAGIIGPIVALDGLDRRGRGAQTPGGHGRSEHRAWCTSTCGTARSTSSSWARRVPDCPTCGTHQYEFLNAEAGTQTTSLCGRDAVQVSVAGSRGPAKPGMSLGAWPSGYGWAARATCASNPFLLRATVDGHEFTVFPDGRAIIKGTQDEAEAATLYARYVGA